MPPAVVIAAKDLRQRIRDRSAIVLGVIAPLVIAALMSLAFQGSQNLHVSVAVVDLDHGPAATAFVGILRGPGLRQIVTTETRSSPSAASAAVRSGSLGAAFVIPPGFSAASRSAHPKPVTVISSVNSPVSNEVATSIAQSFTSQLNADRLSVATATAAGAAGGAALEVRASSLRIPLQTADRPVGTHPLKPISYYGPSMAIFFLLFIISFTSRSYFVDRTQGMLDRMLAAPVRRIEILAGKSLSSFVFGIASLTTIAVVTTVAFGADWGNPAAASVLSLAMVISVVCLTALVIGLARTERQAEGFSSIIVFGLALLGGNFVFVAAAPTIMQRLALLTPNGWALRGYTDLATTGGGMGTVAVPVAAILAFSAVTATLALLLSWRRGSA